MENAENLDIVMPMYNLFECSDNYFMTLGSLLNYYRNEIDGVDHNSPRPPPPGNAGETDWSAEPLVPLLKVEFTIPLKYLGNFFRYLNLPLINC